MFYMRTDPVNGDRRCAFVCTKGIDNLGESYIVLIKTNDDVVPDMTMIINMYTNMYMIQ